MQVVEILRSWEVEKEKCSTLLKSKKKKLTKGTRMQVRIFNIRSNAMNFNANDEVINVTGQRN